MAEWDDESILSGVSLMGAPMNVKYNVQAPQLKLNIGAGRAPRIPGYVHCDLHPYDTIDKVFDASGPWPFEDNSAGQIYASHVIEHLPDPMPFFNEAWRVLHPKGTLIMRLPNGAGAHRWAWGSFCHVRAYSIMAFYGLQGGYSAGLDDGDPEKKWKVREFWSFIEPDCAWLLKWPWNKLLLNRVLKYCPSISGEIGVVMTKVEST